ncbi:MAG: hypothetical protein C7B47_09130 [Sulfobacillus thermosulfidooxidans]|uniref:Helicase XPB/Ssl2 N-terminal domain-containing protein n=1 Tax=Sulfobacillus thermosulfidooxidans TaxID=28034 RepID=A0A2T2WXW1_SULTH|nr:MAG: hypothetical protein C7B47_09130 [Sulfobacillus thermosulfidooxidans]
MSTYYSLSLLLDSLGPEPLWHMTAFGQYSREFVWETLLDPERISQVLGTLNKKEGQNLLQFLVEDLAGYHPLSALHRDEKLIEKLNQGFLLFTLTDGYVRPVIPFDFYPAILDSLLIDRPLALTSPVKTPRPPLTNGFEAILPLFHLLSQARKEPLPITTNGQIYRRSLVKMKKILPASISDDTIDEAMRVGFYYHLLQRGPERTIESSLDVEDFFAHGLSEILSRYLQFALEHGTPFQLITIALAALLAPDEWLDTEVLLKWAKGQRLPGAFDLYSLSYFLDHLVQLGIWEKHNKFLGRLTNPYYFGWLRHEFEPLSDQTLVIEPTGEVLVPPNTSLSTLWDLDGMAEIKKYDQMRVYHINRHSITTAVLDGWEPDTYLQRLQDMSRVPIPSNLEHNIRDWFRQLTRHSVIHATILHSATAEDSYNAERILGPLIIKRLSPTELIVNRADLKGITQALDKSGIPLIPIVHELDIDRETKLKASTSYDYYYDYDALDSRRHSVQQGNPLGLSRKIRSLVGTGKMVRIRYRPAGKNALEVIRLRPIHIDPIALDGVLDNNQVLTLYLNQIDSYEVETS